MTFARLSFQSLAVREALAAPVPALATGGQGVSEEAEPLGMSEAM